MTRRAYQREAIRLTKTMRLFALLFERQAGKSTILGDIALMKMMKKAAQTVIYASASLLLGREIILKETQAVDISVRELVRKDANVLFNSVQQYTQEAKSAGMLFQTADASKDKLITGFTADGFAELFESQKLEFRVYHDRTTYSRTQVIAPNVATARGWSGTVLLDEIAFIRSFMDLWIAIEPIISTNKDFQLIMATTPPQDDTHASFELLSAPAGMEFKPNPKGNIYESEQGITVLRADAFDTFAAGKKIYDLKSGKEITPSESFSRAINKDGWRLNHGLHWLRAGTGACNALFLRTAQERGASNCRCFMIDDDSDMDEACAWLAKNIHPTNSVGLGFDVATTTNETSNPSVVSVVENDAADVTVRAFFVWKTRDPQIARERLDQIVTVIEHRQYGRAKAMAIDASNERYFAEDVKTQFRSRLPVALIVAGEGVKKPGEEKPGMEKQTNWKQYLGDQYVGILDDNHLTLPPETYVRVDHRLVKKDRGQFVCVPSPEGMHGDTFDAAKLGVHAVISKSEALTSVEGIAIGGTFADRPMFIPHRL